jgi:WD40 repeat protein
MHADDPLISSIRFPAVHSGNPWHVEFTPDMSKAVTISDNSVLRVFEVQSGVQMLESSSPELGIVTNLVISRDGQYAITSSASRPSRGGLGVQTISIWDLVTGEKRSCIEAGLDVVIDVYGEFAAATQGTRITVWKIQNGSPVAALDKTAKRALAIGPEAKHLALDLGGGGCLSLVDLATQEERALTCSPRQDYDASIAENGEEIFIKIGGHAEKRKISTADVVSRMDLPGQSFLARFTADGKKLVYPSAGGILIVSTDSGMKLHSVPTYIPSLRGFGVSRDGTRSVGVQEIGLQESKLYTWDLTAHARKAPLSFGGVGVPDLANAPMPRRIAIDNEARRCAILLQDGQIAIVNIPEAKVEFIIKQGSPATCVHIDTTGQLMISATATGIIAIWDLSTISIRQQVQGEAGLSSVFLMPNHREAFCVGYGRFEHVDFTSNESPRRIHGTSGQVAAYNASFSPDGSKAVTSLYSKIAFWDLQMKRLVFCFEADVYNDKRLVCANEIAVSSATNGLAIWDLATCTRTTAIEILATPLAITPEGKYILGIRAGGGLAVYDLETKESSSSFTPDAHVVAGVISRDAKTIVAFDSSSQLHILDLVRRLPG